MGLLDILNGLQNGPRGQTEPGRGGMSPITMAMLALLAYKAYGKMKSGDQPQAAPAGGVPPQAQQESGGLGGLLGGLFGGAPATAPGGIPGGAGEMGGMLNSGLKGLLEQLQQSGQGDVVRSWVSSGPNQQISPHALAQALGHDTVNSLAERAGVSRIDLLNGMSEQLPQLVDQLTPQGRVPTDQEMSRIV